MKVHENVNMIGARYAHATLPSKWGRRFAFGVKFTYNARVHVPGNSNIVNTFEGDVHV